MGIYKLLPTLCVLSPIFLSITAFSQPFGPGNMPGGSGGSGNPMGGSGSGDTKCWKVGEQTITWTGCPAIEDGQVSALANFCTNAGLTCKNDTKKLTLMVPPHTDVDLGGKLDLNFHINGGQIGWGTLASAKASGSLQVSGKLSIDITLTPDSFNIQLGCSKEGVAQNRKIKMKTTYKYSGFAQAKASAGFETSILDWFSSARAKLSFDNGAGSTINDEFTYEGSIKKLSEAIVSAMSANGLAISTSVIESVKSKSSSLIGALKVASGASNWRVPDMSSFPSNFGYYLREQMPVKSIVKGGKNFCSEFIKGWNGQ